MRNVNYEARPRCAIDTRELKQRYSLPFLWSHLGLPGSPARHCKSPLREDKNPSFSVWQDSAGNWRWKDHATGEGGDTIAFLARARKTSQGEAIRYLRELTGDVTDHPSNPGPGRPSITQVRPATESNPVTNLGNKRHIVNLGYLMTPKESTRCYRACEALALNIALQGYVADYGKWKPETIRNLALDVCLGWDRDSEKLVYLFESGMQSRANLYGPSSERGFRWEFGKPFLWRGFPLLDRELSKHISTVYLTEGQSDCIRLIDYGLESDSSSLCVAIPGANIFSAPWAEMFRGKKVFLIPDIDAAGQISLYKLQSLILPVAADVRVLDITKLRLAKEAA
jgi:hypothetical protein